MRIPRILILAFLLLLASGAAAQSQDPSIQYLRKTPVSLFEWGLDRLGRDLTNYSFEGIKSVLANVVNDQIVILLVAKPEISSLTDRFCRKVVKDFKKLLFVGKSNGGQTILGSLFAPLFPESEAPPFGQSLEKITVVRVFRADVTGSTYCDSPLLEDKIDIVKKLNPAK